MDTPPKVVRARALIREVRKRTPDVIALQEVTPDVFSVLRDGFCGAVPRAVATDGVDKEVQEVPIQEKIEVTEGKREGMSYDLHVGDREGYFVMMFVRKGLFKAGSVDVQKDPFLRSQQGRSLIMVSGELAKGGLRCAFFTSHLESLAQGATIRKVQLADIFDRSRELVENGYSTVFAGDTNLREAEISAKEVYKTLAAEEKRQALVKADSKADAAGRSEGESEPRKPRKRTRVDSASLKFSDAWLMAGGDKNHQYTWDMSSNDNLDFSDVPYRPKARYDRVFMLGPTSKHPTVYSFELLGKERLPCEKFISDHYGVQVDIDFTS